MFASSLAAIQRGELKKDNLVETSGVFPKTEKPNVARSIDERGHDAVDAFADHGCVPAGFRGCIDPGHRQREYRSGLYDGRKSNFIRSDRVGGQQSDRHRYLSVTGLRRFTLPHCAKTRQMRTVSTPAYLAQLPIRLRSGSMQLTAIGRRIASS